MILALMQMQLLDPVPHHYRHGTTPSHRNQIPDPNQPMI